MGSQIMITEKEDNAGLAYENINVLGYEISCRGLKGDVAMARNLIASGRRGCYIACANSHSLVIASHDQKFYEALKQADILLPDGEGIVLAARILELCIKQRVTGSDFFYGLTEALAREGGARYFFLGSTNQVLGLITSRLNKEFPEIKVCGTFSPPFKAEFSDHDNLKMVEAVNASKPDVLWVGLTAPKQEKWIYANRHNLQVPLVGAIGAVFDFYAGTKKRPSIYWQKFGLEWLPRFLKEPTRLWDRNLKSMPIFLYWLGLEKLRKVIKK